MIKEAPAPVPLTLFVVPVTAFEQNCSVLACPVTREAAVVDPGGNLERVLALVQREGLTLTKILVTHGHIDHAGGVAELAKRLGLPIEGPGEADRFWLDQLAAQGAAFGLPAAEGFTPARWLKDGDRIAVGRGELEVLACPGHTPGHIVLFDRAGRLAIVGDVLFAGSIGRTDFPRGDYATLIRSIREHLFKLGDDVRFLPGHGPMSTLGQERRTNPFVGINAA